VCKTIKTRLIFILISGVCLFLTGTLYGQSGNDEVVAVVFSVSGDLVLRNDGKDSPVKQSDKIYRSSVIDLRQGTKTGKLQLGTLDGPVVYKKFPVKIASTKLFGLTEENQKVLLASIGGTVLRSLPVGKPGEELFDWFTDIGVLDGKDVQKGFSLVISPDKSSRDNLSLNPLYFRLKPSVRIKSADYTIVVDTTGVLNSSGSWTLKNNDFVFSFKGFKYESGVDYRVETTFTFSDNSKTEWDFACTIYNEPDIKGVEDEAIAGLAGKESSFEKQIIRAGIFQGYNFKLKALGIMKEAGVDLDGML
jgi:hypothetical protein